VISETPLPGEKEQAARRELTMLCRLLNHFRWAELIFAKRSPDGRT
jgi:hypothetical protein